MNRSSRHVACWTPLATLVLAGGLVSCGDEEITQLGPDLGSDAGADGGSLPTDPAYTEQREPCADRNPLGNVYFGDLHVHTRNSFDAWVFDLRLTPEDAYRFAGGASVALPPLDEAGRGTTTVRLERPLDFAAVTDHSEYLAEVESCTTPESGAYDSNSCVIYRRADANSIVVFGIGLTQPRPERRADICGPDGIDCPALATDVWSRLREAAEAAYDRSSACAMTTFVAYEYSNSTAATNLHRNVIFRNANVPAQPISYFEEPVPIRFLAALQASCRAVEGCDVLSIPHNSNWSNGALFIPEYADARTLEDERLLSQLRIDMEPLVEVIQHKGAMECRNGLYEIMGAPDELCDDFEQLRQRPFQDCLEGTGIGGNVSVGCVSRLDFVRNVLLEGLVEEERLGVNPYALGVIGSTDTHNAIPGAVSERDYRGHWGNNEDTPELRLSSGTISPGGNRFGPGGLAAVWAVENSRDALFEAMRRRETYATSGPRIVVRFFGGWDYPDTLCDDARLVEVGYSQGVPMGGVLSEPPADRPAAAPVFVLSAMRDAGTAAQPGTPLQRIQIVKGWLDAEGNRTYAVYEVGGDPDGGAIVDTATCAQSGEGFDTLCSVWTDPDFDPAERAFYYARVVENPSCRWTAYECNRLPVGERPDACSDPDVELTLQERAWSSPIWYRPE